MTVLYNFQEVVSSVLQTREITLQEIKTLLFLFHMYPFLHTKSRNLTVGPRAAKYYIHVCRHVLSIPQENKLTNKLMYIMTS
jgi:hypothetical protein